MRYAVITRHRGEFEVRLMCRVLEVSTSGYYASLKRPPSWHAVVDEVLMAHVRIIHAESGETYGAPRVHRELQAEGLPASPKRVARLMREDGLVARPHKRPRVSTTDSNHDHPIAPNLLARQFDVNGVSLNRCVDRRHHVYPHARRHALPRHDPRSRLAAVCRLWTSPDLVDA
jgi:putative transposase